MNGLNIQLVGNYNGLNKKEGECDIEIRKEETDVK